jgi:hypothetical protein
LLCKKIELLVSLVSFSDLITTDHFLGHLKKTNPNINGVDGTETNPYNPFNPNSNKATLNFNSGDVDPNACHSVPCMYLDDIIFCSIQL